MTCLTKAWALHEGELRGWARHRLGNADDTDDLLQGLFLKALRQGERFCSVHNARAWLFEVARNTLADRLRVARDTVELPDDLANLVEEEDREAINLCDLQGMPQADFAKVKGLTLSGAKSRLQRARLRMKQQMTLVCQVQTDPEGHVLDFVPRG